MAILRQLSQGALRAISGQALYSTPPAFLAPRICASFSTSTICQARKDEVIQKIRRRRQMNPKVRRIARERRIALDARKEELNKQRAEERGDAIRGNETDFIRSFDIPSMQRFKTSFSQMEQEQYQRRDRDGAASAPSEPGHVSELVGTELNFNLDSARLRGLLEQSRDIAQPQDSAVLDSPSDPTDSLGVNVLKGIGNEELNSRSRSQIREATALDTFRKEDKVATEALRRIVDMSNANGESTTKRNVRRIISTFGRHNTDAFLAPRAKSAVTPYNAPVATPRAGPDTGSSEVQIGILTAKIRTLTDRCTGKYKKDKANKHNLRLLLHRRQKLLKYMLRRERGSERWQHMIKLLGLTPAAWEGEISV